MYRPWDLRYASHDQPASRDQPQNSSAINQSRHPKTPNSKNPHTVTYIHIVNLELKIINFYYFYYLLLLLFSFLFLLVCKTMYINILDYDIYNQFIGSSVNTPCLCEIYLFSLIDNFSISINGGS